MARVMIVDDSPTDVQKMKSILEAGGHVVMAATDGEEALERIRQAKPDCVLMDVVMPGINGFAATRTLARDADTAHIPVIVVSSKNAESDRLWALRQGAREYLVKPVDGPALLAKVLEITGGR